MKGMKRDTTTLSMIRKTPTNFMASNSFFFFILDDAITD